MNGGEVLRRLRRLGRRTGMRVAYDGRPGKGSHGRLAYGDRFTTIKDLRKEIGPALLAKMLKDLGIDKEEL